MYSIDEGGVGEQNLHLACQQSRESGSVAAIGHVNQVDASHHVEQFTGEMAHAADTSRPHVHLARVGLGVSDELGQRPCRDRKIGHQEEGDAHDPRGRRNVAAEIVGEIVVERRIDGLRYTHEQECIAVGGRVDDDLGGDVGGGTWPVLDNVLLAGPLRQPLPHQTRNDVVPPGGGKPHNPAHRPVWIGLGPGTA